MGRRAFLPQVVLAIVGMTLPLAGSIAVINHERPRIGPSDVTLAAVRAPAVQPADLRSIHQASFTVPDGRRNDRFGSAVAISGKTVVVGAPGRTVGGHHLAGAAYVFHTAGAGWTHLRLVATLTVPHNQAKTGFGSAVAVSGSTIVVGAPGVTSGSNTYQGAAFVFSETSTGWAGVHHPTGRLAPADATAYSLFGQSVAASGHTIVVGAPGHVVGQHSSQGAAYVFTKPASGWATNNPPRAELTASDGLAYEQFGFSVATSGSTIVAGAPYRKVDGHGSAGEAYVFTKPATGWINGTESAELVDSAPAAKNYLGDAVAVTGKTVAVSLPFRRVAGTSHAGALAVFTRPAIGWLGTRQQSAMLAVKPGVHNAYFGQGVAASGSRIIGSGYGLVSVFARPSAGWSGSQRQEAQLTGQTPADFLGPGIAISGRTVVAGAPTQTVGSHTDQGALYVFRR
jgi:hypothetical protein